MLFWATLGGFAGAPLGALLGLVIAYVCLMLQGVSEMEGRRGLLAAVFGLLPGFIAGFMGGFQITMWMLTRYVVWRQLIAGAAAGVLLAMLLGVAGFFLGYHWAEARGVSNYAGERGAWALFYVAFPGAALGGVAGFLLGRLA